MLESAAAAVNRTPHMPYNAPGTFDRAMNGVFAALLRLGIGLRHNVLLQVRGRKTGRVYTTPVNILTHNSHRYLVAPRGETQWARNARASGEATFVRAFRREDVRLRPVADAEKPEILKAYLDSFSTTVQRFFPVRAGAGIEEFTPIAATYPVFEIVGSARL